MYKYLILAIGATVLSSGTCSASLQVPMPALQAEQVQSTLDYPQVLALLPEINLERRERFLAAVWKRQSDNIRANVSEAADLTDWSQVSEETRNAIQNYVQCQDYSLFSYGIEIIRAYERAINIDWSGVQNLHRKVRDSDLEVLLQLFRNIEIGCPGCALTADLIMSIIRQVCMRLIDDPNDTAARDAIRELHGVLNEAMKHSYGSLLAHEIPNLPEIATKVESKIRVLASNLRSELTGPELGQLASLISQSDISPFIKPRILQKLEKIQTENQKGISSDALRDQLYQDPKTNANRAKVDALIDQIAPKSPVMQSKVVDAENMFGGKMKTYGETSPQVNNPSPDAPSVQPKYVSLITQVRAYVNQHADASVEEVIQYVISLNPNASLIDLMNAIEVNIVFKPATNAARRINGTPDATAFAAFIREHPDAAQAVSEYIGTQGKTSFAEFYELYSSQH